MNLTQLTKRDDVQEKLSELLGEKKESFLTSVIQISQQNEMLKKAEPSSILGAAMTAATLDLPLNNSLGFAYIVPFYDNKTKTTKAQFQIGAKGFMQLAHRTGKFKTIHKTDVREGEIKHHDRLTGKMIFDFIQDDKEREQSKVIGYASYFKLLNGFESTFYMTAADLEKHAKKYSQTYKKGFGTWKDNFDAMASKTVIKLNLSKNAPLSIELQKAVTHDQAIVNENDDIYHIDNDMSIESHEEVSLKKEYERILEHLSQCTTRDEIEMLQDSIKDIESPYLDEINEEINNKLTELKK